MHRRRSDRAVRTVQKTHRGGLPAPTDTTTTIRAGIDSERCDGCGDPIDRTESVIQVRLAVGLTFLFHDGCHDAWLNFDRRA
jgi:hypothetical protein